MVVRLSEDDRLFLRAIKVEPPEAFEVAVKAALCEGPSVREAAEVIRQQEKEIQGLKRKLIEMRKKIDMMKRREDDTAQE